MRSFASEPTRGSPIASFDRVAAIVVTFHPDPDKLAALLDSVAPQVQNVVMVDNGSIDQRDHLRDLAQARGCELVFLGSNVGVAAGHNVGISKARELKPDAVLLLDQDSLPAPDMVTELRRALVELSRDWKRVGAVGPCHVDERAGTQSPFIRFGYLRNQHLYCGAGRSDGRIRCDHLITSGSLIPIAALDAIGGLEEGLFIDNVDTEWCFRALGKGYELFGICGAVMRHGVGDALVDTWVPHPRGIVVHSPQRVYYIVRNHILLYGRPYTPAKWTIQDLPRLLFKAAIFATSITPRVTNLSMIVKGIRDGLRGKKGAYDL